MTSEPGVVYAEVLSTLGVAAGVAAFILLAYPGQRRLALAVAAAIVFVGLGAIGKIEAVI